MHENIKKIIFLRNMLISLLSNHNIILLSNHSDINTFIFLRNMLISLLNIYNNL